MTLGFSSRLSYSDSILPNLLSIRDTDRKTNFTSTQVVIAGTCDNVMDKLD